MTNRETLRTVMREEQGDNNEKKQEPRGRKTKKQD